jgi:hypothetical protein
MPDHHFVFGVNEIMRIIFFSAQLYIFCVYYFKL